MISTNPGGLAVIMGGDVLLLGGQTLSLYPGGGGGTAIYGLYRYVPR